MSYRSITLSAAARELNMDLNELRHYAQRGELPARVQGGEFVFEQRALDEWAQRRLMTLTEKKLAGEHGAAIAARRRAMGEDFHVAGLLRPNAVAPFMTSRNRGGVLRDMTDLAESTGLVYDPLTLFAELQAREEAASTATEAGVAFPHPKYHDPYLFQESFLALGRTLRPVYYGTGVEGDGTDLFFLVCCADHRLHLHVLGRLCLLAMRTPLLSDLREAPDAEAMCAILKRCEDSFLS